MPETLARRPDLTERYSDDAVRIVAGGVAYARAWWHGQNRWNALRWGHEPRPTPVCACWYAHHMLKMLVDEYGIAAPDVLRDAGLLSTFDVARLAGVPERTAFDGSRVWHLPSFARRLAEAEIRIASRDTSPGQALRNFLGCVLSGGQDQTEGQGDA